MEEHAEFGWVCPICRSVYAPSFPWCIICGTNKRNLEPSDDPPVQQEPNYAPDCRYYVVRDGVARCYSEKSTPECSCMGFKRRCDFYGG